MKQRNRVFVTDAQIITGYGIGTEVCADGLFAGRHAFRKLNRFSIATLENAMAATVPDDLPEQGHLSYTMMKYLADSVSVPKGTRLFFAASIGEAEALETAGCWTGDLLFRKTLELFHLQHGALYSGACASGNIALARAAAEVASGRCETALIAGCDVVSEFVLAGFASVGAASAGIARPYDKNRDGLALGDAGGTVVFASEQALDKYHLTPLAEISGWAMTTDGGHIAAPDPEGNAMLQAIRTSLGEIPPANTGLVIGHGTGTKLNDAMEIAVMNRLFNGKVPLVSVKGGTGHSLAASGLIQLAMGCEVLKRKQLFPQTNLTEKDPAANFPVPDKIMPLASTVVVSLNAGFGGLNAVITVKGIEK